MIFYGFVPPAEAYQDIPLHYQDLSLLVGQPGQQPAALHDSETLLPQTLVEQAKCQTQEHPQKTIVVPGRREQSSSTLIETGRLAIIDLLLLHTGFGHQQPRARGRTVVARKQVGPAVLGEVDNGIQRRKG